MVLESRATKMNRENRDQFTREQKLDISRLYQIFQKGGTNQSAKVALDQMIAKYPNAYRTGTTVLDMAEREQGEERVKYLKLAIKDFSHCLYWDGTEVGMKAKVLLTAYENSHRE